MFSTKRLCFVGFLLCGSFQLIAQEVNVYSGRQEALIKPLLDKFTQQSGIKVNLVTGKGDALLSRVKAEGQFTSADMILVADIGRLVRAENMGLTQAIESADVLNVADKYWIEENNHWVALTKRARPIMIKKGTFKDEPITHLSDLTSSKFVNSICIRSSSNIYNQSMVSALMEIWGEDKTLTWAKGLIANLARSPKGGDRDQIKALVAGECSVAIANTYYLGGMLSSKDEDTRKIAEQVQVVWHDQAANEMGVHVNVSGAAIAKYAKNKANAEKLLAYMLTETAQKWYAEVNHEYPVIDDVALSPELTSLGEFIGQNVPLKKVGENNAKALMLMDRAAWK
ncbi:MAG: iron(III) transport system substrate-binding protein [Alphaproteobacteria bacterium]